ncbi:MAG TPA: DinB family protein [Gemmatimonadaceae bacterium]|nr:DinB family protein [Gemmatimonadaceae bacterium]
MTVPALLILYKYAQGALALNLEGFSDEEALVAPPRGGNCANWIAGHVLVYRDRIHALLERAPAWPQSLGSNAQYLRGSTGFEPQRAIPLSQLREALDLSAPVVIEALCAATEELLARQATESATVAERLAFGGFHEGYHAGQLGLLRRVSGKAGQIP